MTQATSTTHRVLLILSAVLLGLLALAYIAVPGLLLDQLGIDASGRLLAMLRVGGTALLGEVVVVVLALRSQSPDAVRIVSVMLLAHFGVETVVRVATYVSGDSPTLVTAAPQFLLAVGLLAVLVRGRGAPAPDGATVRSSG